MSEIDASFFPTPHEIAGGIRWVREHPVVATAAAAAATAVSVISFLRAHTALMEEGGSDECLAGLNTEDCAGKDAPPTRPRFATWNVQYETTGNGASTTAPSLRRNASTRRSSHEDFTPHQLKKATEDVQSSTDSDLSTPTSGTRRLSSVSSGLLFDPARETSSPRAVSIPPTCIEGVCLEAEEDPNMVSPQWGWYVSTTPPDEQYS